MPNLYYLPMRNNWQTLLIVNAFYSRVANELYRLYLVTYLYRPYFHVQMYFEPKKFVGVYYFVLFSFIFSEFIFMSIISRSVPIYKFQLGNVNINQIN